VAFFLTGANGGGMARKGLRTNILSIYNEIDAGDELRIPFKPFLAILHVMHWAYFHLILFSFTEILLIIFIIDYQRKATPHLLI
jgi:hypothetical protein